MESQVEKLMLCCNFFLNGKKKGNDGVIVIGSTNNPKNIDVAMHRRLPRQFYLGPPDLSMRYAILKKVFADPRLSKDMSQMPFDGKRMIYGGFKTIVT